MGGTGSGRWKAPGLRAQQVGGRGAWGVGGNTGEAEQASGWFSPWWRAQNRHVLLPRAHQHEQGLWAGGMDAACLCMSSHTCAAVHMSTGTSQSLPWGRSSTWLQTVHKPSYPTASSATCIPLREINTSLMVPTPVDPLPLGCVAKHTVTDCGAGRGDTALKFAALSITEFPPLHLPLCPHFSPMKNQDWQGPVPGWPGCHPLTQGSQ